ncbi:probable basic-leucine zipper transcription factor Q [Sabethes cyaneus]|uniref:probable basic-leucine zipper transcription factor Q n=1 Tax=Sabethes cyaneus TaxID=53552 RepID=UPI00237D51CE|nr:probable basic-leucine zipper transcription factor Q [Sabethes cyaneus]
MDRIEALLGDVKKELTAYTSAVTTGLVRGIKNHLTSLVDLAMQTSNKDVVSSMQSMSSGMSELNDEIKRLSTVTIDMAANSTMHHYPTIGLEILDELKSLSANLIAMQNTAPPSMVFDSFPSLSTELNNNEKTDSSGWRFLGTKRVWKANWEEYDARKLRRLNQQKQAINARRRRQRRARNNNTHNVSNNVDNGNSNQNHAFNHNNNNSNNNNYNNRSNNNYRYNNNRSDRNNYNRNSRNNNNRNNRIIDRDYRYFDFLPEFTTDITIKKIEAHVILEGLTKLDASKGCGPDGIPPVFLKKLALELTAPLYWLFNMSLESGNFPKAWKASYLIPIFKSGKKPDISNYRGIAIISCIPKLFEAIINESLFNQVKNRISNRQHGFLEAAQLIQI